MKQIGLNLSLVLFLLAPALLVAQPTDIFISEYIEGSSNNKAIEFYNGTGAPINLVEWELCSSDVLQWQFISRAYT